MIGAIAGDIIGSVYERYPIKTKDFPLFHPRCRFTDDTVMTIAFLDARSYGDAVRNAIALGGNFDTRPLADHGSVLPEIPGPDKPKILATKTL